MKTIQLDLYNYQELNEQARKKAFKAYQKINIDDDWWDFIYDDFVDFCNCLGIEVDKSSILFRGFYAKGDGCCFDAKVDLSKLYFRILTCAWQDFVGTARLHFDLPAVDYRVIELAKQGVLNLNPLIISGPAGYDVTANLCLCPVEERSGDPDHFKTELDDIEEWLNDIARILNRHLHQLLKKEYAYRTSKLAIVESIQTLEYLFTANGAPAGHLNHLANQK